MSAQAFCSIFDAIEGSFCPREFSGEDEETESDDQQSRAREYEQRHTDGDDRETDHGRDEGLETPQHLYFDCTERQ